MFFLAFSMVCLISFPSQKTGLVDNKVSLSYLEYNRKGEYHLPAYTFNLYTYKGYFLQAAPRSLVQKITPFSVGRSGKYNMTVIVTTDNIYSQITRNTIIHLGIYVRDLGIKAVVFTDNKDVITFCKSVNVSTYSIPAVNKYGTPILADMITTARLKFPSDFVIYINSDILINPNFFSAIHRLSSSLGPNTFYGSIVYNIYPPKFFRCDTVICFNKMTKTFSRRDRRGESGIDIFVFSPSYPVELIKGAVVGRWRIDPIVARAARKRRMNMVDLTGIPSFHQGKNSVRRKMNKLKQSDFYYNFRFMGKDEDGRFRANYRLKNCKC